MLKDTDDHSIAALAADLRVSRLTVEANPILDLLEIRRTSHAGLPAAIEFLDRNELARYVEELRIGLAVLEGAADDVAARGRVDVEPWERYDVAQVLGEGLLRFAVFDRRHERLVGQLLEERPEADRRAAALNRAGAGENPDGVERQPILTLPRLPIGGLGTEGDHKQEAANGR